MTVRVLVTRASMQAGPLEAALHARGLGPISVPAIAVEIDPAGGELDNAARVLRRFDWVVVTSPNGARAIVAAAERVFTELSTPRWAAIGHGTAEILEREDVQVDFRPSRPESRVLAEEVPVATGQEVLLLRGDLADGDVLARLVDRGAVVADVVAYRTVEGPRTSRRALREAFADGEPAAVVFASGSAVRGLVSLARAEAVDLAHVPAICIGAETEREATRLGFAVLATSPQPDPETLAATAAEALAEPLEAR